MFSYVSLESRVPPTHPLRRIRALLDEALRSMHRDFEGVYAGSGRSSIAPERLVRAVVLQVLYSIRSERLLVEQLDYNLLFHWFVGLSIDEPILGSLELYEKPRPADRGRSGRKTAASCRGEGTPRGTAVERALQCGWDAH